MRSHGKQGLAALGAVFIAALCVGACSTPGKGSLTLAITTDMQTPKDVDLVSVFITTNGVPKLDYIGRVLPDGTLLLPSTLAIVEPDDPNAQVRVRVIAFQTQADGSAKARVVRDVLTTVPHQRTALLRMPLSFLDDGQAKGSLPASMVPSPGTVPEGDTSFDPLTIQTLCDFTKGQTSISGSCGSATVDSSALPDYSDRQVFGAGGTPSVPACFSVQTCLGQAQPVTNVDMTQCSFPLTAGENGQDWNCALATADGTGACFNGTCLVPLESDPGEGFAIQPGVKVQMVPGVCKKLMNAGATLVLNRSACATKTESSPVCQSSGDGGAPPVEAGVMEGGADAASVVDAGGG